MLLPLYVHTDRHTDGAEIRLEHSRCDLPMPSKVFINYIGFSPKKLGLTTSEIIRRFAPGQLQVAVADLVHQQARTPGSSQNTHLPLQEGLYLLHEYVAHVAIHK